MRDRRRAEAARSARVCALACALAGALVGSAAQVVTPAAAQTPGSVYSDISRPRCAVNDRRPPQARDAHDPVIYRCPTLPGRRVTLRFGGTAVGITFETVGAPAPAPQLSTGYDVGPRIEWRGIGRGASFRPQAAILRLIERDAEGRLGAALAIVKIEGARFCPAAFVDGARSTANAEARALADGHTGFRCGADAPRLVGAASAAARSIYERNR